jgi:hypothetical protein
VRMTITMLVQARSLLMVSHYVAALQSLWPEVFRDSRLSISVDQVNYRLSLDNQAPMHPRQCLVDAMSEADVFVTFNEPGMHPLLSSPLNYGVLSVKIASKRCCLLLCVRRGRQLP